MARFILDVMTDDIIKVLDVIERDDFLLSRVASIRCIDQTNDNQFYSWDGNTSPMMNALSEEQLETDREILSDCCPHPPGDILLRENLDQLNN